ncbi:TPA: DUF4317 family protein [Bacillus pseudomycoides]|nr:DUF4317 family protein [Bacillus pseudomycoides]
MTNKFIEKLKMENIVYEYFYYSLCQKSPNELVFSKVEKWDTVEESLKKIFQEQLKHILGRSLDRNFRGVANGGLLEFDSNIQLPQGMKVPKNNTVLNVLGVLVKNKQTEDEIKILGDILSLKYLTAKFSRQSVYGVLTFKVSIEETMHRFAFITLCDLTSDNETLRVDENEQKIISQIIKNAFKEKKLTKGVLYPYIDAMGKEETSLLLYESSSKNTLHWAEAFECKTRLSRKEEKDIFKGLIGKCLSIENEISTAQIGEFLKVIDAIEETAITEEGWNQALQEVGMKVSEEEVHKLWNDEFKVEELTLSKPAVLSKKRDYTILMDDDFELKVNAEKIKNINQFTHEGKVYLVVEGREAARFDGVAKKLDSMSWQKFKEIIEEE